MDCEWPTRDDIMAMPLDKPVRVVEFKWHEADYDSAGNYIGAIQVILENGSASPVFRAKDQSEKALKQFNIGFNVKKIAGTIYNSCVS